MEDEAVNLSLPGIQGLKYFKSLVPMLQPLHDIGCQRDKAGNRKLHYDQYCLIVLLSLFNPTLRSLRALQAATQFKKVQQLLGCEKTSLGSLSEAIDVFDPQLLESTIETLVKQIPTRDNVGRDAVKQELTAVDGSVVKTLASLVEATYMLDKNGRSHCGWRFHTHFDIDRRVPTRMEVTTALNGGKTDEKHRFRQRIESDHCYVLDRWFGEFALFNEIVAARSSYVCRIRDNSDLSHILEQRPLNEAAVKANVIGDMLVELGANRKAGERPDHPTRVVLVRVTPHKKTGGRKGGTAGPPSDGILRIATNMLDVPAEIIADIYRHRWSIEVFFRFFKHMLGCRHLLSTDPVGIKIQAYCAIIASLLISLWTGGRPTQRNYELICLYLQGWVDLDELTTTIGPLPCKIR